MFVFPVSDFVVQVREEELEEKPDINQENIFLSDQTLYRPEIPKEYPLVY